MNRVVIPRMNMRNLPVHSLRNPKDRNMIRDKEPISMAFQIRPLKFYKVMILMSEGTKRRAEFLSQKNIISK